MKKNIKKTDAGAGGGSNARRGSVSTRVVYSFKNNITRRTCYIFPAFCNNTSTTHKLLYIINSNQYTINSNQYSFT